MRFIIADRQQGKTERLLRWLEDAPEDEHRILVSHSLEESHRVQRIGMARGLESWQFVALREVGPGAWDGVLMGRGGHIVLGLDNLDLMLASLVNREVGIVTATQEPDR